MTDERRKDILEKLNAMSQNTLGATLDIRFTDVDDESLSATMPVAPKVHQPYGLLHGGASAALAETLGSCLSVLHIDLAKYIPVGTNLTCNHLRAIRTGAVTGKATFIRKGSTVHVSQIEIRDQDGNLINHTVMTNNIIPNNKV